MMQKILYLFIVTFFLVSCGSTKNTGAVAEVVIENKTQRPKPVHKIKTNKPAAIAAEQEEEIAETEDIKPKATRENIIEFAKTFQGTRYKFGGTTSAGMDCSGLVCTAFQKENISLPRISRDMATKGIPISMKDIAEGDLVFFKTNRKNVISHVGLVVEANKGEVKFIHSTTQAGVIISSLDEAYWKKAFVEVRRMI